jgi:hypothetical protein
LLGDELASVFWHFMNEFTEAIKILKDLGVMQIFTIPLSFLVFAYLFKKIILNSSSQTLKTIGSFLKEITLNYMASEKDRIKLQANIENTLKDIAEGIKDLRRLANKEIKP